MTVNVFIIKNQRKLMQICFELSQRLKNVLQKHLEDKLIPQTSVYSGRVVIADSDKF